MSFWGVPATRLLSRLLTTPHSDLAQALACIPQQLRHRGCVMPAWVSRWCGAGTRTFAPQWEVRNALGTSVGFKLPYLNLEFLHNHLHSASIFPKPCQKWFHRLNPHNSHCVWKWPTKRVICWACSWDISNSVLLQPHSLHLTQASIWFFISPFVTETFPQRVLYFVLYILSLMAMICMRRSCSLLLSPFHGKGGINSTLGISVDKR